METVAIIGATGFIGSNLIKRVVHKYKVIALYRDKRPDIKHPNLTWKLCDLFSISSTTEALRGADRAFYLVHSMSPKTRLFQGNFADTDLLLADNFARACKTNKLEQIIYLGGLVPKSNDLSLHLKSRVEVEDVLTETSIPTTKFRASMVVGSGGSSYNILCNLARNLPLFVLPKWGKHKTQTIYINDVTAVLESAINNMNFYDKTIDLVNGEQLTYSTLLKRLAQALGKKRVIIETHFNFSTLSKLLITLFGRSTISLVSPLVDSLNIDLPQEAPSPLIEENIKVRKLEEMITLTARERRERSKQIGGGSSENSVRSVQRLASRPDLTCEEIAERYMSWLPKHMKRVVSVHVDRDGHCRFNLIFVKSPLLELTYIHERSDRDRKLFYVTGGILVKRVDYGWLEFRQINGKQHTLAVIHEFLPSLPWYIYRYTQAIAHHWVMTSFGKSLKRE